MDRTTLQLEQNELQMPAYLDRMLFKKIEEFRRFRGNSYARLSEEINQYVRRLYTECWNLVDEHDDVTEEEIEKSIRSHVPSDRYISDYHRGRPICFRYLNTMANFFGLEYRISNFDPSKDFRIASSLPARKEFEECQL